MRSDQDKAKEIIRNLIELEYEIQLNPARHQEAIDYFKTLLLEGESKEEILTRYQRMFKEFPCSRKFLQHDLIRFIDRSQAELEMKAKPEEAYVCFRPGTKKLAFTYSLREASSSQIYHINYQLQFPQKYKDPVFLCFFMPAVGEGPNLLSLVGDRAWPFINAALDTPLFEYELKALLSPERLAHLRTNPSFVGSAEQIKAFIAPQEKRKVGIQSREIIRNLIELEYKIQLKPERYQEAFNHFESLLVAGESKEEILTRYLKMFREFPCSRKFLQHDLIRFIFYTQAEEEMKVKPEEAYVCFRPGTKKLMPSFTYSLREASSSQIYHINYQLQFPQKYKDPVFLCFFMPAVGEGPNLLSLVGDRAWPFIKAALDTPLSKDELKAFLSPERLAHLRTNPSFVGSAEQIKAFIAPVEIIRNLIELEYKIQLKPERYQEALNHFESLLVAGEPQKEILARYLKMFREFPYSEKFLKHDLIRFIDRSQAELELKEKKPEEGYLCFRPGSKLDRGFIYSLREVLSLSISHIDYQIRYLAKYRDPVLLCFFMPDTAAGEGPNLLSLLGDHAWPFIKAALDTPLFEHELKVLLSPEAEALTRLRTNPSFVGSAEQIKAFIAPVEIIRNLIELEYKIQLKPERYQEALNHFESLLVAGEPQKEILARYLKMFREFPYSEKFLKHDLIRFIDRSQAKLELKEKKPEEGYLCFRPGSKSDHGFIYSFKNAWSLSLVHVDYQIRYPKKYIDPVFLCFFTPKAADEAQNLLFYAKDHVWPFIKAVLETSLVEHELKALLSPETLARLRTDLHFIGSAEQIKAFIALSEKDIVARRSPPPSVSTSSDMAVAAAAQRGTPRYRRHLELRLIEHLSVAPSPGEPLSPGVYCVEVKRKP